MAPVERLVAELRTFERLLGETFAAGGRLAAAAVPAQGEAGLSPVAAHQVFGAISAANQSVAAAMAQSAAGHRMLERLAQYLGIDATAYGDVLKPPKSAIEAPAEIGALAEG